MARREWRVEDLFGRTWRLHVDPFDASDDTRFARDVIDHLTHTALMRPSQRGDRTAEALVELFAHLERQPVPHAGMEWDAPGDEGRSSLHALRESLLRNADMGRLRVEQVHVQVRGHYEREAPPSEPKPQEEAKPAKWIKIKLVDEAGNPVPGVAYRLECGKEVRLGRTDALGMGREKDLFEGACKVTFPGLHGPEWERA